MSTTNADWMVPPEPRCTVCDEVIARHWRGRPCLEASMNVFQRQLLLEGKSLAELADLEERRQPLDYYGSSAGTGSPEWRLPAIPRTQRTKTMSFFMENS